VVASSTLPRLPAGSEYVALGDSYAAGYGLGDPTGRPTPACGQSSRDYPHRIAKQYGLDLIDVTCAGATSADVVSSHQYRGAPPQIRALSDSTRLVTLTIGGNDSGLFSTAASCLALTPTGPVFAGRDEASCRSTLVQNGVDSLTAKIDGTVQAGVLHAIEAVRQAAPNATVIVVGYPAIFPNAANTPKRGCFRSALDVASLTGAFPRDAFPFTNTDTRYLNGVQARLDQVTASAAEAAGVAYVSNFRSTQARSACATRGAYVAGVTLSATPSLRRIDLVPGALHPNRAGEAYLARRASSAIAAEFG
jgi:lysophospholipase L1-like esterase